MEKKGLVLRENKFKEVSASQTVDKIKGILQHIGIETEESWFPVSSIGTYSLRLNVKGTIIGSNGKGMTREFAQASAYAEFIERLQNNKLQGNATLTTVLRNNKQGPFLYKNEKILDSATLAEESNAFIKMFARKRDIDPSNKGEVANLLLSVQKMDYNILNEKDRFLCNPYYSVKEDKMVYIPYFIANLHYGSNGMCAGNTRNEALVQGLSEVIERVVQTKIVMEQVELPDVPETYLEKYPSIYEMYQKIKESKKYSVILKDCSFGGKYPAVALILLEKDTGKFGVKVGCHPDYAIALERLFTEATQGISVERFARKTKFDFFNKGVSTALNLMNGHKTADALYPYQLFTLKSEYEFVEPSKLDGCSNEELFESMKKLLLDDGYDILIHDVSYLGFPSYQILVPGLSELINPEPVYFEAENTRFHVQPLLNQPKYITVENCKYVISVIKYFKYNLLENSMKNLSGFLSQEQFPAQDIGMDQYYYLAMCYAFLGEYALAAEEISIICLVIQRDSIQKNAVFYQCMEQYLKGMAVRKEHQEVMQYLRRLFNSDICDKVDEMMCEREKILIKQFLNVDVQGVIKNPQSQEADVAREYLVYQDICMKFKQAQQ